MSDDAEQRAAEAAQSREKMPDPCEEADREDAGRARDPQARPPSLVSVDELMETANDISNMVFAHEIMVNQDFQLKPAELPEGSFQQRVKEVMHKAFWDCLEAELQESPPQYDKAVWLLAQVKEILLSFLQPGHVRLRCSVEELLDLPLIRQQAENGALDVRGLFQSIVGMMAVMCAPCRDEDVNKLKEIHDTVPLLRSIFAVLDLMRVDLANFAVQCIRPHLMQQSVEYERKQFQQFLEKQPNALDYTEKWLLDTSVGLREASPPPASLGPRDVHNQAYLRLLRWDHAAALFPETVLLDQGRFQQMQQEVEQLVLLSSLLLIVYTCTGDSISGLPGLMDSLKQTISVMIADMHSPSFSLDEALATIGEKVCVELSGCLSQHGFQPGSADQQKSLKGQISAAGQPNNTVCRLMGTLLACVAALKSAAMTRLFFSPGSRVQSYLLASLESSQHKTPPALPGGLVPVGQELKQIAVRFVRLVNFNKLVFAPFYQKIFEKILPSEERELGAGDSAEGL
ncbi:T-complex protein 11-like protein 1 isoform X1 [Synchiropus splendidus]|uniref:T-complex protein 11-like protein 1 isoform X1 n=3 Tax=Synchiropus splendidus TaxID=270530 RepID=UPI00237E60AA|nr:T-complex protein 11-like protein 1 isoform X1 [Synchiropus splendidus]